MESDIEVIQLPRLQNVMPSLPGQAAEQMAERDEHDARVATTDVAVGVPLFFTKKKKQPGKLCSGRRQREQNRRSTLRNLEMAYSIYVISVPSFVELDRMERHQNKPEKKLVPT